MGNKHLSDVLTIEEVLNTDSNRICILAGVGAGKNTFVTEHLNGHGNILFVSSRRATINEMLLNELCKEKVNWNCSSNDFVTTTNYGVELLVKNKKFTSTGIKNLMEHFDIIVIDEFHSLKADATFSNASFHLKCFLDYISANYPETKIIVLTGTEEPVIDILTRDNYRIIDKRKECINVLPLGIEVITREHAIELIKDLPSGQKTIYYTNSTERSIWGKNSLYRKLTAVDQFSPSEIAVALAKDKANKVAEKAGNLIPSIAKISEETKSYIIENHELPENVRILITTSTLKEGINITSDDIKIAFCESHILTDIQQFAGRIRKGLNKLYVINDGFQFKVTPEQQQENYIEVLFETQILKNINDFFNKFIKDETSSIYHANFGKYSPETLRFYNLFLADEWSIYTANKPAQVFIDSVEKRLSYVRFNHLKSEFEIFVSAYREQMRICDYFADGWESKVRFFCKINGIDYCNNTNSQEIDINALNTNLKEYLNVKLTDENDKAALLLLISNSLGLKSKNPKIGTCIKALQKYNVLYTIKQGHTTRSGDKVRYYMVVLCNGIKP